MAHTQCSNCTIHTILFHYSHSYDCYIVFSIQIIHRTVSLPKLEAFSCSTACETWGIPTPRIVLSYIPLTLSLNPYLPKPKSI